MTVLDPATGYPAVGRLRCTLDEIKAEFVDSPQFAASTTRKDVWRDFETALTLLESVVAVHAVWLAGSFISSKLDPNDIDAVFVVNEDDLMERSPAERRIVQSFLDRTTDADGIPHRDHGLKVDSFILRWRAFPCIEPGSDAAQDTYIRHRGYWDDFWCRYRSGSKKDPFTAEDALPRRGYLEVMVSAYTC